MGNKIRGSVLFKILALVLAAVSLTAAIMSTAVIVYMYSEGYESHPYEDIRDDMLDELARSYYWLITNHIDGYYGTGGGILRYYWIDDDIGSVTYKKNFGFTISEASGIAYSANVGKNNVIYTKSYGRVDTKYGSYIVGKSAPPENYYYSGDMTYNVFDNRNGSLLLTLYFYGPDENGNPEYDDIISRAMAFTDFAYHNNELFWAAAISGYILFMASTVFLLAAAGHRRGRSSVAVSKLDRVPLALVAGFAALVTGLVFLLFDFMYYDIFRTNYRHIYIEYNSAVITVSLFLIPVLTIIALGILMTLASRLKSRVFIKNTLLYHIARGIWRVLRLIPTFWRTLLLSMAAIMIGFILFAIASPWYNEGVLLILAFYIAIAAYACWRAHTMSRLLEAGRRIASGDLSYRVDVNSFHGDFRKHAETLNSIGGGIANAVEERMKGERFKTELITNVSHDLKTPLTSIVNYIDLLKNCDIENDDARNYIEVLERQSGKLRRLTDDLIYASKASAGVMQVELERCDMSVLVAQTAGEYEERLEDAGLHLVVRNTDEPVYVNADGSHTSRIIDNLMSNVQKYAMPGTRVYLDLVRHDGFAGISLRNISREPITSNATELTERFVRGDESRHTEGSGLGLSIASSLAELQGAVLVIDADGDLFRVTLWFTETNG